MDQTNPLAELTPSGACRPSARAACRRERAGFDVRDVHHSHYGRICPIETPEGPNIGLIGSLATYGRINAYGFIETPYRRVKRNVAHDDQSILELRGRRRRRGQGRQGHPQEGRAVQRGAPRRSSVARRRSRFPIRPFVTDEIDYLPADEEEEHHVAQANAPLDDEQPLRQRPRAVRATGTPSRRPARTRSSTWTSAPKQVVSVATALIPFLEHDDANRALMGSNMQRQAVPLLEPESADRRDRHGGARRPRLRPGRPRPPTPAS